MTAGNGGRHDRRTLQAAALLLSASCILPACGDDEGAADGECRNYLTRADLSPERWFSDPLPIPQRIDPDYTIPGSSESLEAPGATPVFVLHARQYTWRPAPGVCIQKWGFEGTTPGPTLAVAPHQRSEVVVYNELPETLYNPYLDPLNPVASTTPVAPNRTKYTMFGRDPERPPSPYDEAPYAMSQYELDPSLSIHLHGGHQTPENDGHPMATFAPGESRSYDYPNNQDATTLWYHDHDMDRTRGHVLMGLAGFYLIEDDAADRRVGLPTGADCDPPTGSGQNQASSTSTTNPGGRSPSKEVVLCDDIPVMFQQVPAEMIDDHEYRPVGFTPPTTTARKPGETTTTLAPDAVAPQRPYRALWTANDKLSPRLTITNKPYRFRFLNGNDELPLTIWTSTSADDATAYPSEAYLQQVGTDGGLMNRVAVADPPQETKIKLFPAQRADVVIDFSSITERTTVYLQASTGRAFVGGTDPICLRTHCPFGDDVDLAPVPLIQFVVEPKIPAPQPFAPPGGVLRGPGLSPAIEPLADRTADAQPVRERTLLFSFVHVGISPFAMINGRFYDPKDATAAPELGATEQWHLVNNTDGYHPVHIHDIEFQVVARRRCLHPNQEAETISDPSTPYDWCGPTSATDPAGAASGDPATQPELWSTLPAEPGDWTDCAEGGTDCNLAWRDVFVIPPYSEITVIGTFTDNLGVYVFHCHNLIHEDAGMMAQFEVIPVGGSPSATTDPMSHQHG